MGLNLVVSHEELASLCCVRQDKGEELLDIGQVEVTSAAGPDPCSPRTLLVSTQTEKGTGR